MKKISILGSTGSIGTQAVEIVLRNPGSFKVVGLAADSSLDVLEEQIRALHPRLVSVKLEKSARELSRRCSDIKKDLEILHGPEGVEAVAGCDDTDIVISAIVGADGLLPTLSAIKAGKTVGLANKESLVASGKIMMDAARRHGARLLPVDSEHSAIFQCLEGHRNEDVRKVILTASGGSLRNMKLAELERVTPSDALNHPNWSMGKKITIDSATLMNKGLEVIEARWLFDLDPRRIDVVIHPQSIIHSMVEFVDGTMLAQMSVPDMKGPISYALSYPGRMESAVEPLDLVSLGTLTFEQPDLKRFPCLGLAYDALQAGGTMPAVLNAANEVAVEAFLSNDISFLDIHRVVLNVMESHNPASGSTIEEIIAALDWGKGKARERISA